MNVPCIDILLVEDDPDDIELTKKAFESGEITNRLRIVRDGQEAIDYLLNKGVYENEDEYSKPGLILLDIKLPKLSGIEVLKKIKSTPELKRIPVIMLTTSRQDQDILASYDNHANSYIEKPVEFSVFIKTIKNVGLYWALTNTAPLA